MSSTLTVYFLTRLNGRFGSSTAGALGTGVAGGVSPNAGGAVPKSTAGAVSTCTVTFTGAAGGGVGAVG